MPRLLPGTSPETDLYALTDDGLSLGRPAVEVAKALLDSGIKILQYREKEKKAGQMLKECMELRRLTREAGACFIVNDHVDIAILCEADGVHVGAVSSSASTGSSPGNSPSRPCAVSSART
jgi:thiamine-phosphate pyrophosphorylase